jgi:hypothetical protein
MNDQDANVTVSWKPDATVEAIYVKVLTRAKERAVGGFHEERERLANQLAARGVRGGAFIRGMEEIASQAIAKFGQSLRADALDLFRKVYGSPSLDALNWLRTSMAEQVDRLAEGLGRQIDEQRARDHVPAGSVKALKRQTLIVKRDSDIEIGILELQARFQKAPEQTASSLVAEFDVFISHAGEDKAELAEPLAAELTKRARKVWLDKSEITIGDRLLQKIDEGLRTSRFGVVILSHHFFAKDWPRWELAGLAALEEAHGRKVILPIWHGLTKADVAKYSPMLAAIFAVSSSVGVSALADEIEKALTVQS